MAEPRDKRGNKQKKLTEVYRLLVIEDDTLREVRSSRFTIFGLITWIIGSILLVSGITFSLFAFTPLRYTIPGYADINNNKIYVELNHKIEKLEKSLDTQKVYTEGFKNLLNPSGISVNNPTSKVNNFNNFSSKGQNNNTISNTLSLEHFYFCIPLKGEVSSGFDSESNHYGVDIVAPEKTPILNILDGVIINSDWSDKTGNTISVQHKGNLVSIFKHNSVLLKKTGDFVKKGEAIAIIGNTGELTSGPHVHFELWNNGKAINPTDYLTFN
jgi:murein DD-endopeptidase MepM/ murein hydrolase activator NlpD